MNLAIEGHSTQGSEVIARLKMLGGMNTFNLNGSETNCYYYINDNNKIYHCLGIDPRNYIYYTLEEFLEKFPYKVGDKVNYVKYNDEYPSVYTIQKMWWNGVTIEYLLDSSGFSALTKDLQPYKEEAMEESINDINKSIFKGNTQSCDIMNDIIKENMEQIKIDIPEGYEFFGIDDNDKVVFTKIQPKYPKTYIECAKSLECFGAAHIDGYKCELLEKLQELLICRDAYWKIAGEQIGLGKTWKPDYITEDNQLAYIITTQRGYLSKNTARHWNYILAFPTKEMRDAFYENFKELIENCKELL